MNNRRLYIAGPYSAGDPAENVKRAIDVAQYAANCCPLIKPYIPHLTHYWEQLYHHEYEFWLSLDFEYLVLCDALFRLPGESNGADKEVALAKEKGIPIFTDLNKCVRYLIEQAYHTSVLGSKSQPALELGTKPNPEEQSAIDKLIAEAEKERDDEIRRRSEGEPEHDLLFPRKGLREVGMDLGVGEGRKSDTDISGE